MSKNLNTLFARSLFSLAEVFKASEGKQISVPQLSGESERISLLEELAEKVGIRNTYENYLRSALVESAGPNGFNFRQATLEDHCHAALKAAESFWIEKRLTEKFGHKN
jgi:hypothetical protein